ncbi:MAG: M48 family metalloprotease [Deltaproteobacteria bacterium]|jgi:predicted Zn-dependent protease|nr:M48 family metalloprotease [Deltaproteobacteria bacterium]
MPFFNHAPTRSAVGHRSGTSFLAAALSIIILLTAPEAMAIGQQEEIILGRKVHSEISSEDIIFDDPLVNAYFQKVCQRVLKAAGQQPFPYHFSIIKSPYLNAFAVPGGYIYLHTGTIESLVNEGQMAAILAHEIAHITSRHFYRRSEAARTASLLNLAGLIAGIALAASGGGGQNTAALGQAMMIGTTGATIQAMLANSRTDETEADSKGRNYMLKAGYHPKDMYGAFKIMNEKSYQLSANIPSYLSTHPGLSSRLASTFSDQAGVPDSPLDPTYLAIRDRVMALTGSPNRTRDFFARRLAANPEDHAALNGLGLVAAREMSFAPAKKNLARASELAPDSAQYLADLGELALQVRQPQEAITHFEAALKKDSNHLLAILGLARCYELTGRNNEAATMYDRALAAAKLDYPPAKELAGRFFSQNGQTAKGHFLMSEFYELTGNLKDSIFHCEAAVKDPKGSRYTSVCERRQRDLKELIDKKI